MADRPTSAAKSVEGLHHEESALDRARALRESLHPRPGTEQRKAEAARGRKAAGYREVRLSDGQFRFMRRCCPWACRIFASSDRKSTRLNSSHLGISYAVFC